MKIKIVVLFVLLLSSCDLFNNFYDVSAPYLSKYGQPEKEVIYNATGYHSIDWWWYTQGFEVTFFNNNNGDKSAIGWEVFSEYSF